jgi:RHS repeat-associated protein
MRRVSCRFDRWAGPAYAENHLIATAGQTYLYDGDGKRVEKATTGTPLAPNKLYWYDQAGNSIYETSAAGSELYRYYRFGGLLVAREEANDYVDHYGTDALGNVRYLYSYNQGEDIIDYYPFGGERLIHSTSAGNNTRLFTGKERDSESGLDNTLFRQYSSSLGRWMRPDPAGLAAVDPSNPQSWNRYAYVLNNPLIYVDPNGLDCVYLNGAGTAVDGPNGVDRDSSSGECRDTGGTWFDGTINSNSIATDPNSDWVFAEGVGEATTGNSQYSCGGDSCDKDALSAFANSMTGGSSPTTVSDTSDSLTADQVAILGGVYRNARIIADASDVAACTATGMVVGHGNIPPVASHIGIERAAHGLKSSKTATAAARAYYTATDARFTAAGRFSKVLVPRAAEAIAPVLGTAGKVVSVTGWAVLAYEGYESGKACLQQVK